MHKAEGDVMSKFYDAMERSQKRGGGQAVDPDVDPDLTATYSEPLREIESGESMPLVDTLIVDQFQTAEDQQSDRGRLETERRSSSLGVPAEFALSQETNEPAYERIVQKLLAFRRTPRQGVILVSGALSGEGTSTITRNTALALCRGRSEQVVLVDANIRNPTQHIAFETDSAEGLVDVLKGPTSLTSAFRTDASLGLSLLTAGSHIESPANLLTTSALQGVMMALTSLFDWVIIDGPPLTTSPEGACLAAAAGGAMLVIRAEKTRQEVAESAKKVLEDTGVDLIGAVLNRRKYHIPRFIYNRL